MKKLLPLILSAVICTTSVKGQDTPNPPSNIQTLPAGSYIIGMDNTMQSTSNPATAGKFNLKAYGLLVSLQNNYIKIKWVITAGKGKDGVDITANAELKYPTSAAATSYSFRSGPFVIFPQDTAGVQSVYNYYCTTTGLTGNNKPKIYRTTAPISVDIRYSYSYGYVPVAAILTDGGNEGIHRDFMIAAGVPAINYDLLGALDLSGCYTFASEPHNDESGPELDSVVATIKRFVMTGRNFLAECHAITTFENNPLGRFQTTDGIDDVNKGVGNNLVYPHADLSYYQIHGVYNGSNGGSVKNWQPVTPSNSIYKSDVKGTGTNSNVEAASVTKLVSGLGGLVFYLGNHDFGTNNEEDINGIRMYMNAFMTPAATPNTCYSVALPVKLMSFQGNLNNNRVALTWTVATNETVDQFELEKSFNGVDFNLAALVMSSEKFGAETYSYPESMSADKVFYRLKMTDKSGVVTYSKVLVFQATSLGTADLKIISNPVNDKLTLSYESTSGNASALRIMDMSGKIIFEKQMTGIKGINTISFALPPTMSKGMYILSMTDGAAKATTKFVKQ